jgi:copper(I)-binding protein
MNKTISMNLIASLRILAASLVFAGGAIAQTPPPSVAAAVPVEVRDGWIRASVPGQSGTGAFMTLHAPSGARLVGVSTPVAGVAEIHEMKMEGDTMRMHAIAGLDLPARQSVELKPGGYHLMLMDLKQPLASGSAVSVTLHFEESGGRKSALELTLPVKAAATPAMTMERKH